MANSPGAIILASDNSVAAYTARATGSTTVSGAVTDITGATVTFTTVNANVSVVVTAAFDIGVTAYTSQGIVYGYLVVDGGAAEIPMPTFQVYANNLRFTVHQTWLVTLAAAGSHTLKLQAGKPGGGTFTAAAGWPHTGFTAVVLDVK